MKTSALDTLTEEQERREDEFVLTQNLLSYTANFNRILLKKVLKKIGWYRNGKGYCPPKDSSLDKNLVFSGLIKLTEHLDGKAKKSKSDSNEQEEHTSAAKEMREIVLRKLFRTLTLTTEDEKNRQKVFVLTQEISSYKNNFNSFLWKLLQELGWTYGGSGYLPPKDNPLSKTLSFSSAIELFAYLDGKVPKRGSKRSCTGGNSNQVVVEYEEQPPAAKEMKEIILRKLFQYEKDDQVDEIKVENSNVEEQERREYIGDEYEDKDDDYTDKGANNVLSRKSVSLKKDATSTTAQPFSSATDIKDFLKNDNIIPSKLNDEPFPNEYEKDYIKQYKEWYCLSRTNHSLLHTGFGSKYRLLEHFGDFISNDDYCEPCFVNIIDAFDKDIDIEFIIQTFFEDILEVEPVKRNDMSNLQEASFIAEYLHKINSAPVYLIIHNIDAINFRNYEAQSCLAALTSTNETFDNNDERDDYYTSCWSKIRIIASVDLVDAPDKLWDTITKHDFNWIIQDIPTHRRYDMELSRCKVEQLSESIFKQGAKSRGNLPTFESLGISSVLDNLANRNFEVFRELALLQTAIADNTNVSGFAMIDCWDFEAKCVNNMHVSHGSQLNSIIIELTDHKLVKKITNDDNKSMIYIPYSKAIMKKIIGYSRN